MQKQLLKCSIAGNITLCKKPFYNIRFFGTTFLKTSYQCGYYFDLLKTIISLNPFIHFKTTLYDNKKIRPALYCPFDIYFL